MQGRVEGSTRSDFAFISHRFALISPRARVGWGLARSVEITNHAATPSPSVLHTFLRYDTSHAASSVKSVTFLSPLDNY